MIDGTPFLKFYARKRGSELDRENAAEAQEQQLLRLIRRAAATRFGRQGIGNFDAPRCKHVLQSRNIGNRLQ